MSQAARLNNRMAAIKKVRSGRPNGSGTMIPEY